MPYIGNDLATQFQAFATQTITGDGSTSYTLDRAVANGKELLVYINNVKQEEGSGKSYEASGTTITFSAAVASGDSCYLVYMGSAQQTVTAPDASIVSGQIANANLELPNTLDMNGNELILDADADTSITADTDDEIQIKLAGSDKIQITELAFMPQSNGSYMLGNSARRWHTIFGADINITGDITVTGNVDGRDVSADGTKLDGIEASADVTDTTNVVAALTAGTNVTIAGDGTISASGGGGGISTGKAIAMSMVFG